MAVAIQPHYMIVRDGTEVVFEFNHVTYSTNDYMMGYGPSEMYIYASSSNAELMQRNNHLLMGCRIIIGGVNFICESYNIEGGGYENDIIYSIQLVGVTLPENMEEILASLERSQLYDAVIIRDPSAPNTMFYQNKDPNTSKKPKAKALKKIKKKKKEIKYKEYSTNPIMNVEL